MTWQRNAARARQARRSARTPDRPVGVVLLPPGAPFPPGPLDLVHPATYAPLRIVAGLLRAEGNAELAAYLEATPADQHPIVSFRQPDDVHVSRGLRMSPGGEA